MAMKPWRSRERQHVCRGAALAASIAMLAAAAPASADRGHHGWWHQDNNQLVPGSLVVSSSYYRPASITPGETLPIGCVPTSSYGGVTCATAQYDGTYPTVFNNAPIDPSFGVTSPIVLSDLTPGGYPIDRIRIPIDQMVTSFSSKSELALNFSTDGRDLTFMGYDAPVDAIDVSNSNTPGVVDPSNPVPQSYYRVVADLNRWGRLSYTDTNGYSGNNGRAAILDNDNNEIYAAGNAGNGNNPEPPGVILGAGAQLIPPGQPAENPPTPFGSFNVSQLNNPTADPPDKIGKDTNFRGLAIYHNVVYLTKGSGGNGIDTVYFVDTTGKACPSTSATPGVGVPQPGAPLPTAIGGGESAGALQADGVLPYNMCIVAGFPTISQKAKKVPVPPNTPFGIWFASPTVLYVADEGDGSTTFNSTQGTPGYGTYTDASGLTDPNQSIAGLEKWVFDSSTNSWKLAYTLQNGLDLGQPYTVRGYPTGDNPATGLPWAPATDGLRNIAGTVNRNGTATIYAVTSTVSGGGDQGADPNKVVKVTDDLGATTLPATEQFSSIDAARYAEVLRGVAIVPDAFSSRYW